MIRTPEGRRRLIPKTQEGYKLRGAMTWVVLGLLAGIVAALAFSALAVAGVFLDVYFDPFESDLCSGWFGGIIEGGITIDRGITAFVAAAFFFGGGVVLWFCRKIVIEQTRRKYGEFASDVGEWFAFGSLLAYAVCAAPLWLLVSFYDYC